LRNANCVWIPGGDPNLLFAVYPNTRVQRELQGVLNRGGVVAGDSKTHTKLEQTLNRSLTLTCIWRCDLRRSELLSATMKTIQQRQARLSGSPAKRI